MKVFLSYASEDSAAADRIAQWLDDKGVAFFDFRNPARNGGRFAADRQEAIAEADFVVALLSPGLLASEWCKQDVEISIGQEERRIAIGETSDPFVYVLQVADLPEQYDGELRRYDWLDVTSPSRAASAPGIGLPARNRAAARRSRRP